MQCIWQKPRQSWNIHCPDWHCAAILKRDALTRREAIRRWNVGEIHHSSEARRQASERDALISMITDNRVSAAQDTAHPA